MGDSRDEQFVGVRRLLRRWVPIDIPGVTVASNSMVLIGSVEY